MSEAVRTPPVVRDAQEGFLPAPPSIDHLITEDDTPVDNVFSEKQQRLFVDSLYSSWKPGRPFVAFANVGVFHSVHEQAIVPDALISLDVKVPDDLWEKGHRSYFCWEFGKPPEMVLEVVSNKKGGEIDKKFETYAQIGVWYYVIFDPQAFVQNTKLRIYELSAGAYMPRMDESLERIGLRMKLWDGVFEQKQEQWLRIYDAEDRLLLTGSELADLERERAEQERERAQQERKRAERLAAQLRALGIEPEE